MERIKPIEIPQSHIDFATAVADLADANGIAEFRVGSKGDVLCHLPLKPLLARGILEFRTSGN